MNQETAKEAVKELMEQFDKERELWIARFGNDEGFNDWFSVQVLQGATR